MGIITSLFAKKKQDYSEEKSSQTTKIDSKTDTETSSQKSQSLVSTTGNEINEKKGFWSQLFISNQINEVFLENLEESLIKADLGANAAMETVTAFHSVLKQRNIKKADEAITILKKILQDLLLSNKLTFEDRKVPVICLVGVNGVGKTTTLAKLAHHFKGQGYSVVVGAADTFRAAAIPQLQEWTERIEVQLVSKGHLSDAAAVAYDAVEAALAKGGEKSLCLIDTAGRLENKNNLMEQLSKLIRILGRFSEQTDLKKLLVLDASLGRNGVDQAKAFTEKIGLDGIILTKTDTQAKAGFLLTISQELHLPIIYLTHGEKLESLTSFSSDEYLEAIFSHFE